MVITNAKYQTRKFSEESDEPVNHSVQATIDGTLMTVPMDTSNRHYAEILKQVADSTITIAEAD